MTPDEYLQLATDHVPACPLCGSSHRAPVTDRDRAGFPATSVCCTQCGLVYITPRLTAEAYTEFYRSGEYRRIASSLKKPGDPPNTVESRRDCQLRYAETISKLLSTAGLKPGMTFLDIGGSIGAVAARLTADYGLRSTVLEPSDEERGEAAARGLETIAGTLDDWEPTERYDIVGLFQTIDHLLHPATSLRKIRERVIRPNGMLAVDVVDFRFLTAGFKNLHKAVKIDHPCAFTAWNMHVLLMRSGFEVLGTGDWSENVTLEFEGIKETIARKRIFFCRPAERADVLPATFDVRRLRALIEGVGRGMKEREACPIS